MTAERADLYVLGLMEPLEEAAFAEELAQDTALARQVGAARDRLLALDLTAPVLPLPEGLADRVQQAIAADRARKAVTRGRWAANLPHAPRRRWQMAAAAVAGLAVGLGFALLRPGPEPLVVAVLLNDQGVPQAVISDYGNDSAEVRFLTEVAVPQGQVMQLWTLPSPETGPVSLGVIEDVAAIRLRGPDLPVPAGQQLYEITFEPAGGSPTGRPTGPILGKGLAALQ